MSLTAPEPLSERHDLSGFLCGESAMDDWLRRRALANQVAGASRTYVVTDGARVIAYYALAAGSVEAAAAPGSFRRNMPDPIPVALLGRLAVDRAWHGRGLGRALFRDASLRILAAADSIGIRGLLVHALNAEARAFWLALGLSPSPLEPMTLMVTLAELRACL